MGLMHSLLQGLLRATIGLVCFTVVGQIPVKGYTLENRYHEFVNAPAVQEKLWLVMRPITWTTEKAQALVQSTLDKRRPASLELEADEHAR